MQYPVLLLQGGAYVDAEDLVCRTVSHVDGPFLLLIPTRRMWLARADDALRRHRCQAVPVNDVVLANGSAWSATPAWGEYKASFWRLAMPDSPVRPLPDFAFCRKGQMWVVRYQGDETYLKDAVGHWYVAHLLARPGQRIYAPNLQAAVTGQNPLVHAGSAGEMSDRKTLENIAAEYAELQDDLEEANQNHDEGHRLLYGREWTS